jgi:LPXTG-motif cell wall-anchored protein
LVVTEDANFTQFYGEDSADDNPDFAAEVSYDEVTSFTYEFAFVENRYGGSLGVMFESYFDGLSEPLANTGSSDNAPGIAFLAGLTLLLAGVMTVRRFSRAV